MAYKIEERLFSILLNIAKIKEIKVIYEELPENQKKFNGFWSVKNDIDTIILGKHLLGNPEKKNFVLAHELGHAILHKNNFDNAMYWENDRNNEYAKQKEREANIFVWALIIGSSIGMALN